MAEKAYLTAKEAAAELGISVATLYAYVSRGLIHSEPGNKARRTKRYRREDVLRLRQRKRQRHNPEQASVETLNWGLPVLESAITLIQDQRFFYRGWDALQLAERQSFEAVIALLWRGTFDPLPQSDKAPSITSLAANAPLAACQAQLALAAADDAAAYDLRPERVVQTGTRILQLCTAVISGLESPPSQWSNIAAALQKAWRPDAPHLQAALNQALILCADHELNVSTFAARCVASAEGTPYDVVQAGLAALKGRRHGRMTERVAALFDEAKHADRAEQTLSARLQRGESVPGFRHQLYPDGDPRGAALLTQVYTLAPQSDATRLARALAKHGYTLLGEAPTLDFGLVALSRSLHLPPHAPLSLFALGRMAGWLAHALEQYQRQHLIRPRADYVGPQPIQSPAP